MSDPSAETPAAPPSLGWLAAHALDASHASPFGSAAFARAASEGLRALASGKPRAESEWEGFAKPFQTLAGHVESIRDPLGTQAKLPLAGIGEAAGAALRGVAAPEAVRPTPLSGIGSAIGEVLKPDGPPIKPQAASWVETGNPSVRRAIARTPSVPSKPPAPAKPAQPGATSRPKRAPAAPDLAPLSRADLPPAQSALEAWAEDLERRLRRARERAKATAPKPAGRPAKPVRKPFVYPEDPADLARFKEILGRQAPSGPVPPAGTPGAVAPTPSPAAPGDTVTPVSPPWPGAPAPADPGIGGILSRLPAPGPRPSGPEPTDVFTPVQPPIPARGPATAPPPVSAPPAASAPPVPAGAAAPAKPRPSEMEWLEEEDDLAARLHSLLRRQARRRGVDLS